MRAYISLSFLAISKCFSFLSIDIEHVKTWKGVCGAQKVFRYGYNKAIGSSIGLLTKQETNLAHFCTNWKFFAFFICWELDKLNGLPFISTSSENPNAVQREPIRIDDVGLIILFVSRVFLCVVLSLHISHDSRTLLWSVSSSTHTSPKTDSRQWKLTFCARARFAVDFFFIIFSTIVSRKLFAFWDIVS